MNEPKNKRENFEDIIEQSIDSVHSYDSEIINSNEDKVTSQKVAIIIFVFAIIALIWSSQAELEITVSTRGEILLNSDIEKVQHLEGGMLEELFIQPGDVVYKGQKIALLRSLDKVSELKTTKYEINQIKIEMIKFKSLITGESPDFSGFTDYQNTVDEQFNLWEVENNKNRTNDGLILYDIKHKTQLIKSMKHRIEMSDSQLEIINQQLRIKNQLYKEEMASYTDVLNMRVQKMNMAREIENLHESVLNESFLLDRLTKQLENTKYTRNNEYRTNLAKLGKDLIIKQNILPSISDKVERLYVYSPVDGTVDKVTYNYISAIISPGDSIADITPLRNKLHAQLKIARKDIGFVEKGQKVKLKFDAYNFAKYGVINGVITSVSRGSYEEKEEEFFLATLTIESDYLENSGVKYHLTPYMEFTADIKTGSRKVIDYALKPIMSALNESFNER